MAFRTSIFLLPFLALHLAAAWTSTEYLTPYNDIVLGQQFATVYPTGPVSITSSTVATSKVTTDFGTARVTLDVTVTKNFLPSGSISLCGAMGSSACPPASVDGIATRIFAPALISNPSCTLTSFTYTTSSAVVPTFYYVGKPPLFTQANDTGSAGLAVVATTYVTTVSVNLGGQPVLTTKCDIYLKPDKVTGLTPGFAESSYLGECVDPRRFLCPGSGGPSSSSSPPCLDTNWVGTYGQGNVTVTAGGSSSPTAGSPGFPTSTKPNAGSGRFDLEPH